MLPSTTLIGRLPSNATIKSGIGANGKEWHILNFAVMFDEYQGPDRDPKAHALYVTMFGPRAQKLHSKLTKGSLVQVLANIRTSSYEANGKTQYKTEFIAQDVTVLVRPKSEQLDTSGYSDDVPPEAYGNVAGGYGASDSDDDLPFPKEVSTTAPKTPQAPRATREDIEEAF